VFLPDMLGWTVLNQLKRSSDTRHIPVQILTIEDERQYGLERGAFAFITKTVTTDELEAAFDRLKSFTASRVRRLLVVEDDPAEQMSVTELLAHSDVEITTAATGAAALAALRGGSFDCVVLDLRLPDMSGFELLENIQADSSLRQVPIVVFTGRDLSEGEENELRKNAKSIVLKGVRSPERLLDETALFLHRVIADLPESKQNMIAGLHESDAPLTGRKVLVVDDDIRNVFALASALEQKGLRVAHADSGKEAIDALKNGGGVDAVLMDVMMPGLDGLDTIRIVRQLDGLDALPIIAVTAKAMPGDRERCIAAGATDYIAKPVNVDALAEMLERTLN
jgi:CheY-like chemotaxis protein